MSGIDGRKQVNRDRYQDWFSRGVKDRTLKRDLINLRDVIRDIDSTNRRIKNEKNIADDSFSLLDDLQDQFGATILHKMIL